MHPKKAFGVGFVQGRIVARTPAGARLESRGDPGTLNLEFAKSCKLPRLLKTSESDRHKWNFREATYKTFGPDFQVHFFDGVKMPEVALVAL